MEVRRQLRDIFRDLQSVGAVVVEQPLSAAPKLLQPPPPSPPPSPAIPVPPSATSPPQPPLQLRRKEPLPNDCATFHCCGCWTVLGDSLRLCAQKQRPGILVCFKVTKDVVWKDSLLVGLEGILLGCTYLALSCRSCDMVVGFSLYSSARDLAQLRGLFCFFTDRIVCYFLKKKKIIKASKVNFPATDLHERLQKLKENVVKAHIRIELMMKQLEELARGNDAAERQSSMLELVRLPPGYAIVRVNQ